jgi:hypothetical protein
MKLIGWNFQGPGRNLNRSKKIDYPANLIFSTKAHVNLNFVSEIRTSKCTPLQLNNRFSLAGSFIIPSVGFSGGPLAFME